MSKYQPLQLVHLSFLHFLCIWHSAHLSLLAILHHFLNQTSNKMKFPRTNILDFVHSLVLFVYQTRHFPVYLICWQQMTAQQNH